MGAEARGVVVLLLTETQDEDRDVDEEERFWGDFREERENDLGREGSLGV